MKKSILFSGLYGFWLGVSLTRFGGLYINDFEFWVTFIPIVILVELKVYYTCKERKIF